MCACVHTPVERDMYNNNSTATADRMRLAYRCAVVKAKVFVGINVLFVLYTVFSTRLQQNQVRSYSYDTDPPMTPFYPGVTVTGERQAQTRIQRKKNPNSDEKPKP